MIAGKVWGASRALLAVPGVRVNEAEIRPSSFCSWHCHRTHWNAFYCAAGEVVIEAKKANGLTDRTILSAGEFTAIRPGEKHRFVTGELGAIVLEIYWPDLSIDDIERDDTGGTELEPIMLDGETRPTTRRR